MSKDNIKRMVFLALAITPLFPFSLPCCNLSLHAQTSTQQVSEIRGTVIDESGEPIMGATVIDTQNPANGSSTDLDGNFSITASQASINAKVSYIGYKTLTVTLTRGKNNTITLSEDQALLDEVMIVAFGEQKRSAFTGSATVVDNKILENKQLTNALAGLQGEAAGVQMSDVSGDPTSTPSIRIRGFSSINAGNDPLIILDGAPYEGGWNNINPSDIESMTVLKDAASAALYGARGSNGVILITTKKAKAGKSTIIFDSKWGASQRIQRDYETISDPGQYYEVYYKALYNYAVNGQNMNGHDAHVYANQTLGESASSGGLGYLSMHVQDGQYLIGDNGRLNPQATLSEKVTYNGQTYTITPDNWMKESSRTGLRKEYNLSANGGNDLSTYYFSVGYLNTEGITRRSDFERFSTRLNTTYQFFKWLKFSGNASYTRSKSDYQNSGNNIFSFAQEIAPVYPLYIRDANGNIMTDKNGLMYDYGDATVLGLNRPYQPKYNPVQDSDLNTYDNREHELNFNGAVDITPLEGLKFTVNAATTYQQRAFTSTSNPFYGYSASIYPTGYVSQGTDGTFSYNFQQKVNYTRQLDLHNLSVLAGHENYSMKYDYLYGSRTGMASYLTNQTLSGAIIVEGNGDSHQSYNNEGWFMRGMYDFDEKYYANASIRADASSRFAKGHQWGAFYSLGGSWIVSREDFMESARWISMLKFKASFGQVGNDNIGDFRYMDTYQIVNSDGNVGLIQSVVGNENITWETANSSNAGIEFELFKSRVRGGLEYYYKNTTDMLFFVSAPKSMGYGGKYYNVGDMVNQGVEIELSGDLIRTKALTWSLSANASFQRNHISKIISNLKTKNIDGHAGYSNGNYYYGEGLPLYTWYIPRYAGLTSDGRSQWYKYDDNGNLTTTTKYGDADYFAGGTALPDVYGGFSTALSAYGFDLNIQFVYSIGGKAYDNGYATLMTNPVQGTTGYAIHKDMLNAWSSENTGSEIPRWQYGDQYTSAYSDRFLTDASSLTLSSINLGYTVPTSVIQRTGLTRMRFYLSGSNLYYWTARKGFDPRSSFNGDISTSTYSPARTISGGLTITY